MRRAGSSAAHTGARLPPFPEIAAPTSAALQSKSRRVHRRHAPRRSAAMSFRTRLFAFLALTGVLPVALLGWLSFSLHRAEVERTVSRAQVSVAAVAAGNGGRRGASVVDGLRVS